MSSRTDRAERTATQAWDYLSSAMGTAGETAREAADAAGSTATKLAGKAGKQGSKLAGKARKKGNKTGTRVNSVADEARARANAAAHALAGRRPGLPWGLLLGASLIGVAIGWAAASSARAALERQAENEELELAETAILVTPTYDD